MISRLSCIITEALCQSQVIEEADRELYIYGFFVMLSQGIFFLLSVLFGCMFGALWESAVFYIMFSTLRSYAGGYHASKESVCTCCTTASLFLASLCIWILSEVESVIVPMCVLALCGAVVYFLSPLDSEDKPLSYSEYDYYRWKTRVIVIAIELVSIGALYLNLPGILYAASTGMALESNLLVLEEAKRLTKH